MKSYFKRSIVNSLWLVLGRERLVRFSRFLANESRLDVSNEMSANGEASVQRVVLKQARDCAVVFDVGANIGLWTRSLCSTRANEGAIHIHAFEPCAGTRQTLQTNLRNWGLHSQVTINDCALSSTKGEASFFNLGDNIGRNGLHPTDDDAKQRIETVRTATLDEYCAERKIARIDLLKIDTEGHDLEVIYGAQAMLEKQHVVVVQFEYNHRWVISRHFLRDAFEFFTPLGYTLGKITPRGIEFYPRWDMELESFREANFVAVKSGMVENFPQIPWWKEAA